MDGYLKIKTKIDNNDVDKDIKQLEDKIKKMQTDNSDLSQEQNSLQKEIDSYKELCNKVEEYKKEMSSLQKISTNGNVVVTDASKMTQLQMALAEANTEIDKQAAKIEKVNSKLNKIKSKQVENNSKIAEYRQQIERINMKNIQQGVDNVGKSITNQIGKLGKMAMAVFGIRTAFTAVTRAVNMVKQYNPQIAADFEYMGYCIANIVAPAVQKLIQLLYTVLSYVNAITTAWFGINLFANSSAKSFQKMKSSAKEIQKSLQGFDEMNVVSDSSSGSANVGMPSMDLSGMQGEVPAWLQWIIDNKDLVLSTLAGIATGILLIKFGLGGIKALGIGVLVTGIIKLIQDLQDYLKDPSWENFGNIISDIGLIILGLGIIIGGVPAIIAGVVTIIVGLVVSNWEKIKQVFQNGIDWLTSKTDWVKENFGAVGEAIYKYFLNALQNILNWVDNTFTNIKKIFDGLIMFIKGVFSGNWKQAWEGIKQIFSSVFNSIVNTAITIFNIIFNKAVEISSKTGESIANVFKAIVNAVLRTIENVLNAPIRAINGLIGAINAVPGINMNKLNTFNLPRLAKGGVISQPTQAIIGEAGKEAVVPLENNLEWLDILADKLASKIGNGGGSYIIQLDSRTIQRGFARKQQELAFAKNGR